MPVTLSTAKKMNLGYEVVFFKNCGGSGGSGGKKRAKPSHAGRGGFKIPPYAPVEAVVSVDKTGRKKLPVS